MFDEPGSSLYNLFVVGSLLQLLESTPDFDLEADKKADEEALPEN